MHLVLTVKQLLLLVCVRMVPHDPVVVVVPRVAVYPEGWLATFRHASVSVLLEPLVHPYMKVRVRYRIRVGVRVSLCEGLLAF